ncbi:hypothetical protein V1511DRAFT_506797, partial [Dipodascopsis uninucleata]
MFVSPSVNSADGANNDGTSSYNSGVNSNVSTISPKESVLNISEPLDARHQDNMFSPVQPSNLSTNNEISHINLQHGDLLDRQPFSRPLSSSGERFEEGISTSTQSLVSSPAISDFDEASSIGSPSLSTSALHNSAGAMGDNPMTKSFLRRHQDAEDQGVFLCTDCGRRFPKAHNLQLHRRTHSVTPPRKRIPLSAQTGPHRCTFINPSTNKVCNKVFSRPYDLIRHQETIHAVNRKTYKCEFCGDDTKTFSRQDALARHIRVKHEKGK